MTTEKERAHDEAVTILRELLKPGDTVYTVLTHVSRSGMQRHIKALARWNDRIIDISYYVADVLDWKLNKDRSAVKVDGCGMDMGFDLVYNLSYEIFKKDAQTMNGEKRDAGYWLIQRWL